MLVSWNWLKEFIDLGDLTPQQVADKLTMSGMEVEGIHEVGAELNGIVLGKVVSCEQHPDADSLRVTQVDAGTGERLQVVCGAPNVAEGVFAPLATIGTTMPQEEGKAPFVIKKSKLRGQPSHGMLCSASELGMTDTVDGLMLFETPSFAPGTAIAEVLGVRDWVIEIGLTPNRPDGLSIRGVAREVAVLFDREWKDLPSDCPATDGAPSVEEKIKVTIDDAEGCPRYAAAVIENIKVGPSPEWLQARLKAVGQRPVNNIVDVTNYILMEQGQPLHAFDLDRVAGAEIVVRRARDGETIKALDGTDHALLTTDLVIADAERPSAIAGVMGGAESEIKEGTTRILIECANFDPATVRRTARRLGMHTESSHRFERGVDRVRIVEVLARAVALMVKTQVALDVSCSVSRGVVDNYPLPYEAPTIALPVTMPERVLGVAIAAERSVEILNALGLTARLEGDTILAEVPAYRPDLERPIDLVEEVGRVFGYENIPSTPLAGDVGLEHVRRSDAAPKRQSSQPVRSTRQLLREDRLRGVLTDMGAHQAVNWGFGEPSQQAIFSTSTPLKLRNPLGADRSVMRQSLLPGLLDNVAHNLAHGSESVALFEVGTVFPSSDATAEENPEPRRLAMLASGNVGAHWSNEGREIDGHDVVGWALRALEATGVSATTARAEAPDWAHPGVSADIQLNGRTIGWVGRLHPSVTDQWDIEAPVYGFDIDMDAAWKRPAAAVQHVEQARTPAALRDLAFVVDAAMSFGEVQACSEKFRHKHLESVALFDVYEGDGLEEGKKSLAFRLVFRDGAGTLTDKQVDKLTAKYLRHMEHGIGATLRT